MDANGETLKFENPLNKLCPLSCSSQPISPIPEDVHEIHGLGWLWKMLSGDTFNAPFTPHQRGDLLRWHKEKLVLTGFKPDAWLEHLKHEDPWESYLNSLDFNFLIYTLRKIEPTS